MVDPKQQHLSQWRKDAKNSKENFWS